MSNNNNTKHEDKPTHPCLIHKHFPCKCVYVCDDIVTLSTPTIELTASSNQIVMGPSNTTTIHSPTPASNQTVVLPDR